MHCLMGRVKVAQVKTFRVLNIICINETPEWQTFAISYTLAVGIILLF